MKTILFKVKPSLVLYIFLVGSLLGISISLKAQTITESFEESEWTTVTTGSKGTVNLTASTELTLSVYTTYGQSGTLSTVVTNNSGRWLYSGISYTTQSTGTNTGLRSQHSRIGAIKMNSSKAYIITPIMDRGVIQATLWIAGSSGVTKIGLLTGTNTISENPANTSWITSAVIVSTQSLASTIVTSGTTTNTYIQKVTYNPSFSGPCQIIIGNLVSSGSSSAYIDDIEITTPEATTKLNTPPVAVGPTSATNQGFTAQWGNVDNEDGYTITVYKSSDNSIATTVAADADATSKVITGLIANTSYYYKVVAEGSGSYRDSDASSASAAIRTLNTAKDITAFTIAGVEATINETIISAEIPYSESWTQTPEVTVSQYADYSPKTAQNFSAHVQYTVTAEDSSEKVYTVIVTKASQSDACEMISFSIPGQISSEIDGTAITVVMPHGTDVTNLTPTVEISLAASYVSVPENTKDFTNPVTYYVVSESESKWNEYTVTVQIAEPSITACPGPYNFSVTGWAASASQTCSVTGSNLVADISVSVDAPFQVSNNNSTWATTTSFTHSDYTASGTLYIRYNPSSGDGDDTGTVTLSTTGATNKSFTVNGTAAPAISSPSNKNQTVKQNVAISDVVFTLSGSATTATLSGSLPSGITYNPTTNTISGSSLERGTFNYTLTTDGNPEAEVSGTIIIKGDLGGNATGKIAYVTTAGDTDSAGDQGVIIRNYLLGEGFDVTFKTDTTGLAAYDCIIHGEFIPSGTGVSNQLENYVPKKPFLNMKQHAYGSTGRWEWATTNATDDTQAGMYTLVVTQPTHDIFKDIDVSDNEFDLITARSPSSSPANKGMTYFNPSNFTNVVRNVNNDPFVTLAYIKGVTNGYCISEIPAGTTMNGTVVKGPFISLGLSQYGTISNDGKILIKNILNYLLGGGREHSTYDYYRTKEDGTWANADAWQSSQDGTGDWGDVVQAPGANAAAVQIANRVTVADGQSATIEKVKIDPVGKLIVEGTLTISDTLTFVVNESGVSQVLNNGEITNNGVIKVRKTIKASNGWGFVSFPFNVAANKIFIAGTSTPATWGDLTDDGKDFYVAEYDAASRAAGNFNATNSPNWISVSPHVLVANKGYIMAVDNDITLDFISSTGEADLFQTSAQVSVAKHPAIFTSNQDWNLIGVPFSSSYELANASAEHAPYYCHNGITYSTVMPEDTYETSPFTAFFLQAYGAPSVVSFASNGRLVKAAAVKNFSEIGLVVKNAKYSDMTRIRLQDGASAAYELGKDAVKFFSNKLGVPQIAAKLGALALSVNSVPANTTKVEITVTITEDGTYTINLDGAAEGCSQVILVDGEVETDLLADDYSFAGTAGSTKNMSVLLVTEGTTAVGTVDGSSILIQTIADKAYISGLESAAVVNVYDVAGKLVQRFTNVNNGDALTLNNAGVAIIDVKTATQAGKAKVSVKK